MKRAILMLVAATVLLTVTGSARADIIFNDYGPADTYNLSGWSVGLAVEKQYETASQFTAGITAAVTQVDIGLSLTSGTNAAVVDLMEDRNGAPGAILETYDFVNQMGPTGTQNPPLQATSITNPILYANTVYWLAVFPASPTANTSAEWNFNNQTVIGLIDQSTDNGGTWFSTGGGGTLGAFEIFGNPVGNSTPEPATATLLFAGLSTAGGLGLLKRRRRNPSGPSPAG
jgi:hypothetical protein